LERLGQEKVQWALGKAQVVSDQPEWRNGARQHFEKWCTKLEAQVSRQESEVILIYLLERMG
jgi:predicted alpha/beta hydrolase family esterase